MQTEKEKKENLVDHASFIRTVSLRKVSIQSHHSLPSKRMFQALITPHSLFATMKIEENRDSYI